MEPIEQVLDAIDEELSEPDSGWVAAEHVRRRLGWPEDRLQEIKNLMAELLEAGDIVGPRSGRPLTDGAGRVLDVDVRAITPQGRRRLEAARMPAPQRVVTVAGPPVLRAAWMIVAGILIGVTVAAIVFWLRLK